MSTEDIKKAREEVLAFEECACQAAGAIQSLNEHTFVIEDMAAMMHHYKSFTESDNKSYFILNEAIVRNMAPSKVQTTTVIPQVLPVLAGGVGLEDIEVENIKQFASDFKKKALAFSKQTYGISQSVSNKLKKAYYWVTMHRTNVDKKLAKVEKSYKDNVTDSTVTIHGWKYHEHEVETVDEAIKASDFFLRKQLPVLIDLCDHMVFVLNEAMELGEAAISGDVEEYKLKTLYKSHNEYNVEKIIGGTSLDLIDGRTVSVSSDRARATTIPEFIDALTAIQITFEKSSEESQRHNTPSATEEEVEQITKLSNQILTLVDITEPGNHLGKLQRMSEDFSKLITKLDKKLSDEELFEQTEEIIEQRNNLIAVSRMMTATHTSAVAIGASSYTAATDVVEKLLSLIKLKD